MGLGDLEYFGEPSGVVLRDGFSNPRLESGPGLLFDDLFQAPVFPCGIDGKQYLSLGMSTLHSEAISPDRARASGNPLEIPGHLVGPLEVELVALECHAPLVMDGVLGLDAQEHLVGLCISRFQVVAVVGGHYGGTTPACQVHDERVDHVLVGQAVMLDLQVEGTPEGLPVEVRGLGRASPRPLRSQKGISPLEAGGQSDEPLAVLGKCPSVYPRFVVESPWCGPARSAS